MYKKRDYSAPVVSSSRVELVAGIATVSNTANELPVLTENIQTDWNFD